MEKRETFNNIISDYDKARPGYPKELYTDITEYSAIEAASDILEVGSGTGQATEHFILNGYNITSLEIGKEQVQYLSRKYSSYNNFKPIRSSFEQYDNMNNTYDLIFSATAFHWIKAEIGYPKAYNLLKDKGTLAIFWHMSPIIKHKTEMFIDIRNIYHKYAPQLDTSKDNSEIEAIHKLRMEQIQTNNLFQKPFSKIYKWNEEYTAHKYIRLLNTYSSFQMLERDKREFVLKSVEEYINSKNGKILVPQEVRLYLVKKHI